MATDPLHYYAAEWRRLRSTTGLSSVVDEWARTAPELPGPAELTTALAAARAGLDYERSDALLHGLLRCAASAGQPGRVAAIAAAAYLEPAMGRVVGTVFTATRRAGREVSVDDIRATVAGALWETIRCYPLTRRRAVAANIAADVTQSALRTLDCHGRCRGRGIAMPPMSICALVEGDAQDHELNASEELVQLLSWAITEQYVTRAESDLVLRRWATGTKTTTVQVIADERGWTRRTANRRCNEAVAALTTAALQAAA